MSSISAGTSAGTALVSTGDTTGALVFKTGGSATTAMTIGADQSVTFAGAVSGTPGSGGTTASGSVVLTSASAGAQSITTTAYGQSVTLPSATTLSKGACLYTINNLGAYPLKIINNAGSTLGFVIPNNPVTVGLANNSTTAGTWSLTGADPFAVTAQTYSTALYNLKLFESYRSVIIDSTRTLFLLTTGSNTNIYGIIFNSSTNIWGSVTLIRTTALTRMAAILSATDQVLVTSIDSTTGFEAVVLTLSNTSITVGAAATATLSAGEAGTETAFNLAAVGASWVCGYAVTGANQLRALTISGTTVTIGSATVLNGTTGQKIYLYAMSSSVVMVLSNTNASTFFATPYTISGTTITAGTGATYATTSANSYRVQPISSGARLAVVICNTAATSAIGLIISLSGTIASISTVTLATIVGAASINGGAILVSGSKLIFVPKQLSNINILTDSSGTASAGTSVPCLGNWDVVNAVSVNATTNLATFLCQVGTAAEMARVVVNFSSASPTISAYDAQKGSAIYTFAQAVESPYDRTESYYVLTGSVAYTYVLGSSVVSNKASAVGENTFYSFYPRSLLAAITPANISGNKKVGSIAALSGSTTYGMLQIIESIT